MKAWWCISTLVLVCGYVGVASGTAAAAPGDLDRFFGQEGIATLEALPGGGYVVPTDMAVGSNDEIYVVRRQQKCDASGCLYELAVTRYNAHAARDLSFGVGGVSRAFQSRDPVNYWRGDSLAVGSDGKVVLTSTDHGELILIRINPDGSLDSSFGVAGVARSSLPGVFLARTQVAIDDDGSIVVGTESAESYGPTAVAIWRYTNVGAPDPTFNGGKAVVTGLGGGFGGLAITGNSGVAIAGPLCCGPASGSVHVGRLSAAGVFDRRFGNRGHRFVDDVVRFPRVAAVIPRANGKIDVVGSGGKDGDVFILRLLPGGRLDPRFGDHGTVRLRNSDMFAAGAAVDDRGRLVIAGGGSFKSPYSETSWLTLLRRRADGIADRTFGGGSRVRLRGTRVSAIDALAMQSGGRIVVMVELGYCERSCPTPKAMLVRYRGGSGGARCKGRRATIIGTRESETLTGTPRHDVIAALSGNDVVRARGGNDLVCGGRGDDRLIGGKGRDRLIGGAGRNRVQQ